jgi:hypothetical protein
MSCNCDENPLILPIGPQGEQGPVGPVGPIGLTGAQGEQGIRGPAGNSVEFIFNSLETFVTTYEPGYRPSYIAGYFRFPGTIAFGTPATIKAILTSVMDHDNPGLLKLRDVTNNVDLASYNVVSNLTNQIVSLPILTTFPTAEAVIRIDMILTDDSFNPSRFYLHALDITV